MIDLLAVLPTWIALVLPESRFLGVIRIIRVLRIFRILKLTQYVAEASMLTQALVAARYKIVVFMFTIVTMTTVGYGIIAVPTGIVTMELQRAGRVPRAVTCPRCP